MPSKRPNYFSMHDDEEFKVLREITQSLKTMTPEEFHDSLVRAGMITKSGRLTKPFRELYEQDMAIIEASNARDAALQGTGPSTPAVPAHDARGRARGPSRPQATGLKRGPATPLRKATRTQRKTAAPGQKSAEPRAKAATTNRKTAVLRAKSATTDRESPVLRAKSATTGRKTAVLRAKTAAPRRKTASHRAPGVGRRQRKP